MSIVSKFLPSLRNGKTLELVPIIIQRNNFRNERCYSTEKRESSLAKSQERVEVSTDVRPLGEKIKETTKTVSYTGVILLGVGVTGIIFYYVFRELFSSNSANSIYSTALEKCKEDPRVEDALGAPIKGYGEETTRRRRTHVSHAVYEKDGVKHMRMRFYIKGIRNKAVVELDMQQVSWAPIMYSPIILIHPYISLATLYGCTWIIRPYIIGTQNDFGNYQCRYLLVQLDDYSGKTFIIEDNRAELDRKDYTGQLPTLTLTQ